MRKLNPIYLAVIVLLNAVMYLSCSKQEEIQKTSINYNSSKIEQNDKIVESSNIKSEINTIITEISITNKKTKIKLPSFIYKFISNNKTDIRKDLKVNPKFVSGTFTIEVDGQLLYKMKVINGNKQKAQIFQFNDNSQVGKKYPCSIAGNFQCAVDAVNNMNWFDYALCLSAAPACLAQTHISCLVDNC